MNLIVLDLIVAEICGLFFGAIAYISAGWVFAIVIFILVFLIAFFALCFVQGATIINSNHHS